MFAPIFLAVDPSSLAAIAHGAEGRVGAAAEILESGKTILEFHASDRFPMQSVYKLPIAMAALAGIDQACLKLDQRVLVDKSEYVRIGQGSPLRDAHPEGADVTVEELLRLTVSQSDGSASDVVLRLIGGPPVVMKYLHEIGVSAIEVRDSEKRIGADWQTQYANGATPAAAVELLRAFHDSRGLSPQSHEILLKWMTAPVTLQTRIKGLLPPGTVVAHKTGTGGTRDGVTSATNDIGIATLPDGRHLAIAVFVSDAKGDAASRDTAIARIARAAWDEAVRDR